MGLHVVGCGSGSLSEQFGHRLALVEEEPAVAGRHPFAKGGERCPSGPSMRRHSHDARVPAAGSPRPGCRCGPTRLRDLQHAVKQAERLAALTLGDQQTGERELVVLGQVGGGSVGATPRSRAHARASSRRRLSDPDSRAGCGDRPHIREVARQEERLGLVEHRDGALEVASRPQQSSHRRVPAMPVLEQ